MGESVRYERRGDLGWIQFDDGKANVLNAKSFAEWFKALDAAEADDADALVVAGTDGFFSAGLDLKELAKLDLAALNQVAKNMGRLGLRLFTFPRPVVAAVTGHAIAGGGVILLGCDLGVGTDRDDIMIGLSEVAVGAPAGGFALELAIAHLTPRGQNALLHGKLWRPLEAREVGYLEEVVAHDQVVSRATELAQELAGLDRRAYALTKMAIRGEAAGRIEAQLDQDLGFVFEHFTDRETS